ncbi:MAG: hypothetical protein CMJ27_08235 [Phycisphaerae bacterium]|nr:hypothetical protein [Phycisphaerae bacterium]
MLARYETEVVVRDGAWILAFRRHGRFVMVGMGEVTDRVAPGWIWDPEDPKIERTKRFRSW